MHRERGLANVNVGIAIANGASVTTALRATLPVLVLLAFGFLSAPLAAQERAFLQVEAQPTLPGARAAAERYAAEFEAVAGFRLGSGWYAIALGPFADLDEAEAMRRQLFAGRRIPPDAFVVPESRYVGEAFWPAAGLAAPETPTAEPTPQPEAIDQPEPDPAPEPEREETLAEARAAEAQLDRDARAEIQMALAWFGHYGMAIDAAFGPGTRRAMAEWQTAQDAEPTGVLTTRQRAALVDGWLADLAAFGFDTWRDEAAGIEITLPLAMVEFDRVEAPFVHFRPVGDSGVRVLLISQEGTLATLFGLYEIMQTLEIVPLEGFRERGRNFFTLTGQDETLRSYTRAEHRNGQIKGFTLIWGPEQDARMERALATMRASLRFFGPALPDGIGQDPSAVARQELLSGLEIRRPERAFTGFYIDADGKVLTSARLVEGCQRLTIDERVSARIGLRDDTLGIVVLDPEEPLAPLAFANFAADPPRLRAEVALAGFSFEDLLTRPVLTFGQIAALEGLEGEAELRRLALAALPGDIGGPVFDRSGTVVGMLLPQPAVQGRLLPEDVSFAVAADAIQSLLRTNGLRPAAVAREDTLPDTELGLIAADMTVLVSCWN